MLESITRRRLLAGSALLLPALTLTPSLAVAEQAQPTKPADTATPPADENTQDQQKTEGEGDDADKQLAELEKKTGGRLGVAVLDTETNISLGYRENERFFMCSTYKALAAGFVLARADKGEEKLDRRVMFGKDALVSYSPVTEKHAGTDGMTVAELCEAAITMSDNTAGNLLLDSFGGPSALTAWLRATGDDETRLDRREPDLNEAKKGDLQDTTTPDSMLDTIGLLTLGDTLSEASRNHLIDWMVADKVGDARLRAGVPKDWKIGDKTGTGNNGALGDIAVIWPPDRGPFIVAVYIAEATAPMKDLNDVFAAVGKLVSGMAS
ncbi:class A beta-lactamase [Neorhizobium sp. P12A]|uniref:class A beta-lactamase n=1 Tax=Neorhizobium sp. P12A TaxID=2268027 RepID=UPI0011ED946F|nr:class A beta-lactamase [Neorhizobium sp. P12A]KAA0699893.1 class A beta-lactamase [Neorhizobium sp. P12A]